MQKGMRIKSRDIHFVISIFFFSNKCFHWHFMITQKLNLLETLFISRLVILPAFKIERACSIPPASSWRLS